MSQSREAWAEVAEQLNALGSTLKDHYAAQEGATESGVATHDEVKEALKTLGDAATAALGTIGEAMKDPTVKEEIRATAGSFVNAMGVSMSELGSDISASTLTSDQSASLMYDKFAEAGDSGEESPLPESD
ncbi:MAG: hypothetical protein ACR2N9_00950 [Acidimicrobiia bacterium]